MFFLKWFREKAREKRKKGRGFLVFESTSEVIRAEKVLKKEGYEVSVMGPPSELRTGCDLVIEIPLIDQVSILRVLERVNLKPLKVVPVSSPLLEPVSIFHVKDFGEFIMVRAANMKISIEKATLTIVNVSGGGCPDVPFVASKMVGKSLLEAPSPTDIGHTLCAYALQLAFNKAKELCLK